MLEEARQIVEDSKDYDTDDMKSRPADLKRRDFNCFRADGLVARDGDKNCQPHCRGVRYDREWPHEHARRRAHVLECGGGARVREDGREAVDDERTEQEQYVRHGEALQQEHRHRLGVVSTQHEQRRQVARKSYETETANDEREDDEVEQTAAVVHRRCRRRPVVLWWQHK